MYLLLPGVDKAAALTGIERLVATLEGHLAAAPLAVSFPADAVTLGALIDGLHPPRRGEVTGPLVRGPVASVRPTPVTAEADGRATA